MTCVRFHHGLGDTVYFSLVLQMYAQRGIPITVQVPEAKACLIQAAGHSIWNGMGDRPVDHPWEHATVNLHQGHGRWLAGNKIGWQVSNPPLPYIGEAETLWDDLLRTEVSLADYVTPAVRNNVTRWYDTMQRPIVLFHQKGATNIEAKSLSDEQALGFYQAMASRCGGTLVILDWHGICPPARDRRQRTLDEFGTCDVPTLWELIEQSDLMIGCDSGPLHLARLTGANSLGIWQGRHYPARYSLPREEQLNVTLAQYADRWNRWKRIPYNIVEQPGGIHDPEMLADLARQMLGPPQFFEAVAIAADIQLREFLRRMRNEALAKALQIASRRFQGPMIVETGSMNAEESWHTQGMSTYVLGAYAYHRGGTLISIDRDHNASTLAHEWTRVFEDSVVTVCGDAGDTLRRITPGEVQLLYLDAGDPFHEWQMALPALAPNALVLINHAERITPLAMAMVKSQGWHVLHHDTQLLFSREAEE